MVLEAPQMQEKKSAIILMKKQVSLLYHFTAVKEDHLRKI